MQSSIYLIAITGMVGFIIGIINNTLANFLLSESINNNNITNLRIKLLSYFNDRRGNKRHLIIELLSVVVTMVVVNKFGLTVESIYYLVFIHLLLILFVTDWERQLLPDILTLSLIWVGLLYQMQFGNLQEGVIGAMAGYLSVWSIYWLFKLIRNKEGMGYGDFKLLAALGAWFGWQALPQVVLIAAGLWAMFFVFTKKRGKPSFCLWTVYDYGSAYCVSTKNTMIN